MRCVSCVQDGRACFHASTGRPAAGTIPLRCADCVLDQTPCVFDIAYQEQDGTPSTLCRPLEARWRPRTVPPAREKESLLSSVFFTGIQDFTREGCSKRIRSIGGVAVLGELPPRKRLAETNDSLPSGASKVSL